MAWHRSDTFVAPDDDCASFNFLSSDDSCCDSHSPDTASPPASQQMTIYAQPEFGSTSSSYPVVLPPGPSQASSCSSTMKLSAPIPAHGMPSSHDAVPFQSPVPRTGPECVSSADAAFNRALRRCKRAQQARASFLGASPSSASIPSPGACADTEVLERAAGEGPEGGRAPDDRKLIRLIRNRQSAQDARDRKKRYVEELEQQVAFLRAQNHHLKRKVIAVYHQQQQQQLQEAQQNPRRMPCPAHCGRPSECRPVAATNPRPRNSALHLTTPHPLRA